LGGGNIELKPGHIVSNSSMDWANQNSPYLKAGWDSPAAQASYGSQGQYGGSSNTGLSGVVNQQARRQGGKEGGGGRYRNQGQSYNQGGQNPWTTTGGWKPPAADMSNPSFGYTTAPTGYGTPYNPFQGTDQQAGTWQDQSAWGSNTQYQPTANSGTTTPSYGQTPSSDGTQQPWQNPQSTYNPNAPTSQATISALGYDPKPFNSLTGQASYDYYDKISQQNPYVQAPSGYGDYMTQKTGTQWVNPNPDTMDKPTSYYEYFDQMQTANPNAGYVVPRGYDTWKSQQPV